MSDKKIVPKYEFKDVDESVTPYKRVVSKTMEVTETFTPYDAMQYVAKMEKAKEQKMAEIESLDVMIKAYKDELEKIEEVLGLKKLEEEFIAEEARKVSEDNGVAIYESIINEEKEGEEEDK